VSNTYGDNLKRLVYARRPRHLLVDVMYALFSHGDVAVDNIMTFLRQVMSGNAGEETIGQGGSATPMDFTGYRMGLLSSVTRKHWLLITKETLGDGMDTRMNVFKLMRSEVERQRVRQNVIKGVDVDLRKWKWTPDQLSGFSVKVGGDVTSVYEAYMERFFEDAGNRGVAQMNTLLHAMAFVRGNRVATLTDLYWLITMHDYWLNLTMLSTNRICITKPYGEMDDDVSEFVQKHWRL
jgi:hypothetical protein